MLSNKGDNEKRVTCPYDPSHIILHYRMQTHLVKCRRNHPEAKKVICIFNSTHQVPEPELKYHYESCSNRDGLDKSIYLPANINLNRFPIPDLNVQATENWDDEVAPTYNPEEYCKNNIILRNTVINTQSAAVRRNFRMEERQRIQLLQQENAIGREPVTRPRRPVGASGGRENRSELISNSPLEDLMAKVNLGSKTLTTPKLSVPKIEEVTTEQENKLPENEENEPWESKGAIPRPRPAAPNTIFKEEDYPQLGAPRSMNRDRNQNRNQINFPVMSKGRGRGSSFAGK